MRASVLTPHCLGPNGYQVESLFLFLNLQGLLPTNRRPVCFLPPIKYTEVFKKNLASITGF